MNKKIIEIVLIVFVLFSISGCITGLDNYDSPNGGIKGEILDEETNNPIPLAVQGPTGVIIKMHELNTNAKQSIDFYAKYDGTFENSKMFNNEYKLVVNGPFVKPCEQNVKVNGGTTINLKALPFSRIEATVNDNSTDNISIEYEVKPTNNTFNVDEVFAYWNFAPGVDDGAANYAKKISSNDIKGQFTFNLEDDKIYKDNKHKIISNGNKIYVRVGALVQGNINYSKIITIQL